MGPTQKAVWVQKHIRRNILSMDEECLRRQIEDQTGLTRRDSSSRILKALRELTFQDLLKSLNSRGFTSRVLGGFNEAAPPRRLITVSP